MVMPSRRALLILFALLLAIIAIYLVAVGASFVFSEILYDVEAAPRIILVNRSGEDLHEVVVEGRGFEKWVGELPARSRKELTVLPTGESGLTVNFAVNSEHHVSDYLSYFERSGGYVVIVTIDESFDVSARTRIGVW